MSRRSPASVCSGEEEFQHQGHLRIQDHVQAAAKGSSKGEGTAAGLWQMLCGRLQVFLPALGQCSCHRDNSPASLGAICACRNILQATASGQLHVSWAVHLGTGTSFGTSRAYRYTCVRSNSKHCIQALVRLRIERCVASLSTVCATMLG